MNDVKKRSAQAIYKRALSLAQRNGPSERVLVQLTEAARLGSGEAAYALWTWYRDGVVVKKSPRLALEMLRAATRRGLPEAWHDLANCYERGFGVKASPKSAFRCYLVAAFRGNSEGVFDVGRCMYFGIGAAVDRDAFSVFFDHGMPNGRPRRAVTRLAPRRRKAS